MYKEKSCFQFLSTLGKMLIQAYKYILLNARKDIPRPIEMGTYLYPKYEKNEELTPQRM